MKNRLRKLLHPFTGRAKNLAKRYFLARTRERDEHNYHVWATENEQRCFVGDVDHKTHFSIVVPAYNTGKVHLLEMVYSVINQHHQQWELIIANGSTDQQSRQYIADLPAIDSRIKIIDLEDNKGISGNTNAALEQVQGDYVVFVDHDDVLHPCALHCLAGSIATTNADIVYTDEDKMSDDSTHYLNPFMKPDWSPLLFENVNYINHLTTVKASLVKQVGGLRPEYDGAQDYDFLLRVIDSKKHIVIDHVPRVLYHWRAAMTSTARNIDTKSYVLQAGQKAISEHLQRSGIEGQVEAITGRPGFYKTTYKPAKKQQSALVIGKTVPEVRPFVTQWIASIAASIPHLETIHIGSWCRDSEIGNVHVENYQEEDLSTLHVTADIVVYSSEAFAFSDPSVMRDMIGLASHGYVVAPTILEGADIMSTAFTSSDGVMRPLFAGVEYGKGAVIGSSEWVRHVDGLASSVLVMNKAAFIQHLSSSGDAYVSKDDAPAIVWAHSPLQSLGVLDDSRDVQSYALGPKSTYKRLFRGQ